MLCSGTAVENKYSRFSVTKTAALYKKIPCQTLGDGSGAEKLPTRFSI